jgi:hypothetical protein
LKLSSKHPYFYSFVIADIGGIFCSLPVSKGALLLVALDRTYLVNYSVLVHIKRIRILKTKTTDMRRRCGDEEADASIICGATSRAPGELSRLWRLETHHQEAFTGATAAWAWEASAESTVSKQTPGFIVVSFHTVIFLVKNKIFFVTCQLILALHNHLRL